MKLFDIPLKFSKSYIDFVNKYKSKIYSVYFSIPDIINNSARMDFEEKNYELLNELDNSIQKNVLLNGRFAFINNYDINQIKKLKDFLIKYDINNIVFLDTYFLLFLIQFDDFFKQINYIPSINFGIDSIEKFYSLNDFLELNGLKKIKEINIDRNLNLLQNKRNILMEKLKKENVKVKILVNEGCLFNCPFKCSHDFVISILNNLSINNSIIIKNNFEFYSNINEKLGCIKLYKHNPYLVLKSPFIRPEELQNFDDDIIFKIAGRTFNEDLLKKVLLAYFTEDFDGNLLEILDSLNALKYYYYLDNKRIPNDFFEFRNKCNKKCENCNYCKEIVFSKAMKQIDFEGE